MQIGSDRWKDPQVLLNYFTVNLFVIHMEKRAVHIFLNFNQVIIAIFIADGQSSAAEYLRFAIVSTNADC